MNKHERDILKQATAELESYWEGGLKFDQLGREARRVVLKGRIASGRFESSDELNLICVDRSYLKRASAHARKIWNEAHPPDVEAGKAYLTWCRGEHRIVYHNPEDDPRRKGK